MTDTFDQASETEALTLSAALAAQAAKAAASTKLEPTGECLNPICGEPVDEPRLFCGPKCAQGYARYAK